MTDVAGMKQQRHCMRFPWREGNSGRLHRDGDAFFPSMLQAIAGAQNFILLEMYLVESGQVTTQFIDALLQAARRGVRVWCLFDAFGSWGLSGQDASRLSHPNLQLSYFNPLRLRPMFRLDRLFRDHRKLLVLDGGTAFVGGTGLSDSFAPAVFPERYWSETMVEMAGPVVTDWVESFRDVWERSTRGPLLLPAYTPAAAAGALRGRVAISCAMHNREIKRAFFIHARRAKKRVWLATPYFIPSGKNRRILRGAARREVDVRVLLPGPFHDHPVIRQIGRRFYLRLLLAGVRIFEYQPRFFHYKAVVCDDWLSLGSSNFDRWNLRWNFEANQEIEDAGFSAQLAAMFEADCAEALEIRLADVAKPGWPGRLRLWFWSRVDQLVAHLSHSRSRNRDLFDD